jgi:hypothetical protein
MTRWVAFIQLFSFTMKHVPGKTFTMPDGLSRRPPDPGEVGKDFDEEGAVGSCLYLLGFGGGKYR